MSRFFATGSDSESESESSEEEQIPQKATAITSFEELTDIIKQIKNHKKIKDMSKLLTSFENLTKAFQKAKCWEDREGRKNMSKNNSKSLATLRQKLRKYNKDHEADIAKYRENPEEEDEEREDDEDKGEC
ncbi:hypothetical protein HPB52_025150 [Rhipicephalus sanguineus]|uniref:Eukaryotic translation initiation factor 3 subunit C N-terminal domain-containing protein n=1 Tax=Rhipicephalus sanguineus TaxID=34632 RepID=A0A9D4TDI5_RHISA|nr:hypothetical protein HPB52_025150 [Rhipicephalus sanguineus]